MNWNFNSREHRRHMKWWYHQVFLVYWKDTGHMEAIHAYFVKMSYQASNSHSHWGTGLCIYLMCHYISTDHIITAPNNKEYNIRVSFTCNITNLICHQLLTVPLYCVHQTDKVTSVCKNEQIPLWHQLQKDPKTCDRTLETSLVTWGLLFSGSNILKSIMNRKLWN